MRVSKLSIFAAFCAPVSAKSVVHAVVYKAVLTYNTKYDNMSRALNESTCWDKKTGFGHGSKDWQVQGDVPVGVMAVGLIEGPGSRYCGTCWTITSDYGHQMSFLAVDHANSDSELPLLAMDKLANGKAVTMGSFQARAIENHPHVCGITPPEDVRPARDEL